VTTDVATPGREFARRFINTLCELHLQQGIHRRIETIANDFAMEHPNVRAMYVSREVDDCYFEDPLLPPGAAARPRMHGIAIDGEQLYEFVAFSHGLRTDVVGLSSIVSIEETWTEPSPETPFVFRVVMTHTPAGATVLLATTGEMQDAVRDFVGRIKYLKGW
jgi:hypothetical protein